MQIYMIIVINYMIGFWKLTVLEIIHRTVQIFYNVRIFLLNQNINKL